MATGISWELFTTNGLFDMELNEAAKLAIKEGNSNKLIEIYKKMKARKIVKDSLVPLKELIECGTNAQQFKQFSDARRCFRMAKSIPLLERLEEVLIAIGKNEEALKTRSDIEIIKLEQPER